MDDAGVTSSVDSDQVRRESAPQIAAEAVTIPHELMARIEGLESYIARIGGLEASVARIDGLEASNARFEGLGASIAGVDAQLAGSAEVKATVEQMQQVIKAVMENINGIGGQVDVIQRSLYVTVGFAAQENFTCDSCNSHGFVAAKLLCTSCGKENLWGWYPPPPEPPATGAMDGVGNGTADDSHIPVQAL